MKKNIKDYSVEQLSETIKCLGKEKYRTNQLIRWLYRDNVYDFSDMTNISKDLMNYLDKNYYIEKLKILKIKTDKIDKTKKILFQLKDNSRIESVIIPEKDRNTICISSQAGCNLDCVFCTTSKIKFIRNLTISEISEQILQLKNIIENENKHLTNIVFMGMGEPFLNYENVINTAKIFSSNFGIEIASKKITISTSGIAPKIYDFANENINFSLAVSLNAVKDSIRSKIMPINKKYNLNSIFKAIKFYHSKKKRQIVTLGYVMLKGINDNGEDLQGLIDIGKKLKCKINLIEFNPTGFTPYLPSPPKTIDKFFDTLNKNKVRCIIRKSKGKTIEAACGQLYAESD